MEVKTLAERGCRTFLSGMALGTDQWAASAVLALRREFPDIRLHCVLPCTFQDNKWTAGQSETYHSILNQADSVICVNYQYTLDCMMKRNRYLVDHASMILAVYNGGKRGGTAATVRYARSQRRELWILDPLTLVITHETSMSEKDINIEPSAS